MNDSASGQQLRFGHYAEQNPDALAVVDGAGRHWSRGEIAGAVNRLSRALRASGVVPGDIMAIVAPNCAQYLVAYFAATQIGLYVVPVNWHLAPPEIQYILENSRARVIVVHERFRSAMDRVLPAMPVPPPVRLAIGNMPEFVSLDDFSRDHDSHAIADPLHGRMLAYTSATTGKPKGVVLPLQEAGRMLDRAIKSRIDSGTLPEVHVQLLASVLYHGAPLEMTTQSLHMGHVVVLMDSLLPEVLLRLIDQYRVTIVYLVPVLFTRLLGLSEEVRAKYSLATLRRAIHTGAMCPVEVKRRMIEWWGPIFVEAYGATEGAGTLVLCADWLKYPGTVGRPMQGSRLKILSDEGEELPQGAIGTIYLTRYGGDRFEYLGDPEKTRACQLGEFFTVGDVGYLNEEGFLFLSDRKIDMINLGGTKVYSAEIENVLVMHPHVADCAVFGIPDPASGEAVVALIQPAADAPPEHDLIPEVLGFLGEHLSIIKVPRYTELIATLPRDDTGKLRKRHLREAFIARRSAPALAT